MQQLGAPFGRPSLAGEGRHSCQVRFVPRVHNECFPARAHVLRPPSVAALADSETPPSGPACLIFFPS